MNKLVVGSIAAGAGIALLIGGAGTLAYWNDSADVGAGIVASGTLSIDDDGLSTVWTSGGSVVDASDYLIVPGDTLTLTKELHIVAEGDNLHAELGIDPTSLATAVSSAADQNLGMKILEGLSEVSFTSSAPASQFTDNGDQTVTINAGTGLDEVVTLTVKFTFPQSGAAGAENNTMNGNVNFSNIRLLLTQTP